MRILFIHNYYAFPELCAGTEMTLHWLCRILVANGHEVVVAARTNTAVGTPIRMDRQCGYPVVRAPNAIDAVCVAAAQFRPDVFVVLKSNRWIAQLPQTIRDAPMVVYEHDVSMARKSVPAEFMAHAAYIANSATTAAHLLNECGIASTIIPPLFGVGQYAQIRRYGNSVLFVSLQLRKGADVAIRIAQSRPRIPFIFIESWSVNSKQTQMLRQYVGGVANISLLPNQQGLGHIMPQIKLLLMPSRSQEAWGRTATEAQVCGIPVLASSRGNLPVTIGAGGMTLDPDEPIEHWLKAFDSIMDNPAVFEDLSRKALEHGRECTQAVERAYRTFENVLLDTIARRRA
jgi:glycosyltransferase involved in cell wall biosynthesis